jgi:hypothetical protein
LEVENEDKMFHSPRRDVGGDEAPVKGDSYGWSSSLVFFFTNGEERNGDGFLVLREMRGRGEEMCLINERGCVVT